MFGCRWNNIPDQYGWSFALAELRDTPRTSPLSNETTVGALHPRGSHCAKKPGGCLRGGFLPYDLFPRTGDWASLKGASAVYHLTFACAQEEAPCSTPGVRPFRGHRQRLDRYEAIDFDDQVREEVDACTTHACDAHTLRCSMLDTQVGTLRELGLWLVDAQPEYVYASGGAPDGGSAAAGAAPVAKRLHDSLRLRRW